MATADLKKSADVAGFSDIANDLKGLTPRGLLSDTNKPANMPEVKVVYDPDAT